MQLQRLGTLEAARAQLSYEEFKLDMLGYIAETIDRIDMDEVQGQPSVLRDFPDSKIHEEEVEEDQEDETAIDKEVALPEKEDRQVRHLLAYSDISVAHRMTYPTRYN
jgi:hypothetical protein